MCSLLVELFLKATGIFEVPTFLIALINVRKIKQLDISLDVLPIFVLKSLQKEPFIKQLTKLLSKTGH